MEKCEWILLAIYIIWRVIKLNKITKKNVIPILSVTVVGVLLGLFSAYIDNRHIHINFFLGQINVNAILSNFGIWILIALFISLKSEKSISAAIRVLFFFLSLNITFHIYHLLIHVNVNSYMLIWYTITAISPFLAVLCHKIKQDNILAVLLSAGVISVMLLQIMSSNHDDMYCEIIFLICAIILMHKKLITTLISLCIGPAMAFFLYQMPFFS